MLETPVTADSGSIPRLSERDLDAALLRLMRMPLFSLQETALALLNEGVQTTDAAMAIYWVLEKTSDSIALRRLLEVTRPEGSASTEAVGPPTAAELSTSRARRRSIALSTGGNGKGSPDLEISDVGVWRDGELAGALSFARGGGWTAPETAYLSAVADRVAILVERDEGKRAEEALRDRERELDEIEELTNLGSWEWYPATGRIIWSAQQLRIHGNPTEERERTFDQFMASVHPDDHVRVLEECDKLVNTGEPFSFPYRIVRSDGTIREMHALGKLLPGPRGAGVRAVGTSQDVTERNRAERALRQSEESYRTIFECASEGIWVHDVQTGEMVDVNAAGGALYGYTAEEMMAVGHDALNFPDSEYNAEKVGEYMARVLAGEAPRFEWLGRHKDGSEVWGEVTLRKVVIGGEERILASTRDIRERKKAERALQRANEELEQRVADRTAELAAANSALASEVAEHQHAREQLTRRTNELEGVFAALPDVYLRLALDGAILDHRAGQGATPLVGTAELVGRRLGDVLPSDVAGEFASAMETVQRIGGLVCIEYRLAATGVDRYFEARLLPSGDGSLITIVRDITDRKATEEAVRRSEEHFRKLIENGSDYIMIVEATGAITYVAPSSERLLGYTQEEMLGKMPSDLVHPEDLPTVYQILSELVAAPGRVFRSEYRILHKDGSWRVFESFGRTLLPDTPAAGVVVNSRDVTDSKKAEADLIRQKAYFEEILDSIDAGISVFDREGRYEYVSAQSVRDPELRRWAIGRTVREYGERRGLREQVIAQREESLAKAVRERAPNHFEQDVHTDDGSVRHMYRRLIPLFDESGQVVRMVGYSIDITERKKAEIALHQAKEEAERANRAKSEFLSRMSHELRTPLNGILGFAQVLERDEISSPQRKYVGHILKGGRHLLRLINEVLELSRIEAGRMSLSLEPIQVSGVLREALDLVRPLAEQARIELELDATIGTDSYVRADRQRLVQVLLNLLSNGIKYNRPGGSVRISCAVTDTGATRYLSMTGSSGDRYLSSAGTSSDRYLSIRVEDSGRGIPEDRLDQLFVPFARLGAEQTETEGTGLGLALSKRLAEAMGGVLRLERTGREGSVFRLDLLRAGNPLDEMKLPDGGAPAEGAVGSRAATILYIEDNLTNLSLVETFLESKPSWRTVSALRGRTGIELAREKRPDLILLDLHLPDLHGEEVLRELRQHQSTAHIPVVVISADATPAAIQRLRVAGSDAYLTKPLDLDEFLTTVERFLP